jgi:hypothetical protein
MKLSKTLSPSNQLAFKSPAASGYSPGAFAAPQFQGKYCRSACKDKTPSPSLKLMMGEMDQAAMALAHRIKNELPPEIEIHYKPVSSDSLYLYQKTPAGDMDDFCLLDRKGRLSHVSWSRINKKESCLDWLNRTIDDIKKALPLNQALQAEKLETEKLETEKFEREKREATQIKSQVLQEETEIESWGPAVLDFPWIECDSVLKTTLDTAKSTRLTQAFEQHSEKIETLLKPDWYLDLGLLGYGSDPHRLSVSVRRRISPYRTEDVRPTGYSSLEGTLYQQWVPRYGGIFSILPVTKLESEQAFVERVIQHIETLKEREGMVKRFDEALERAKAETLNNFDMPDRDFLVYHGEDAPMKLLAVLQDYSLFLAKLDPKLVFEYRSCGKDRDFIYIMYRDENGLKDAILGSRVDDGTEKAMVYRKRKQTPEQFLAMAFQEAKTLLSERKRVDKLLATVKKDEDFSV